MARYDVAIYSYPIKLIKQMVVWNLDQRLYNCQFLYLNRVLSFHLKGVLLMNTTETNEVWLQTNYQLYECLFLPFSSSSI